MRGTSTDACTLTTSTGRPMKLCKELPTTNSSVLFSAVDIGKMQNEMNLSRNQTLTLMRHIRSASCSQSVIEPFAREKLKEKSHQPDAFFKCEVIEYVNNKGEKASQNTIICLQPDELKKYLMTERKINEEEEIITKIGIDGGGGFLKVCLSIQLHRQHTSTECKRMKLSDGVAAKVLKDSSVKKLLLLAITPHVEENYANMQKLWRRLKLNDPTTLSPFVIATDLKLANIMLGLMAHGSCHPCAWCDVHKDNLISTGQLRTLGNIQEQHQLWANAGEDLKNAKLFGNCIHAPIFQGEKDTRVIDIIPPPELHLMTGPVNTLFNALLKKWPSAMQWAAICNVTREAIHGGSFTGNSCRKLLSHVADLAAMCPPDFVSFVNAFNAFNGVIKACYGYQLDPHYKEAISTFKHHYTALNINVTPKVHAVFHNTMDFCESHKKGLGQWSEQASEAVHYDFTNTWMKYPTIIPSMVLNYCMPYKCTIPILFNKY